MRIYGIQSDGSFREYVPTPFQVEHQEKVLEDWLEANPRGIVEDSSLLIIGRQVRTDFNSIIDLLALDREGRVAVIELKRDRTPRDTLAQALEYAAFAARLDAEQLQTILCSYLKDDSLTLADYHREYFQLSPDDAVAFNKDQRIVIVGQTVSSETRQTASFLAAKGISVTCIEFAFFQSEDGTPILSQEVVVGQEAVKPGRVTTASPPAVTRDQFMASLDDNGRRVFSRVLEFAQNDSMEIIWGTRGFSMNVVLDGTWVGFCFGYPPQALGGQSLRTTLRDKRGIAGKTAIPEDVLTSLHDAAQSTGMFRSAGSELRCSIDRAFTDKEIQDLLSWFKAVTQAIRSYGLKQ